MIANTIAICDRMLGAGGDDQGRPKSAASASFQSVVVWSIRGAGIFVRSLSPHQLRQRFPGNTKTPATYDETSSPGCVHHSQRHHNSEAIENRAISRNPLGGSTEKGSIGG
jgi:hypothetical protein